MTYCEEHQCNCGCACPCHGEAEDPGEHIASCLWADPAFEPPATSWRPHPLEMHATPDDWRGLVDSYCPGSPEGWEPRHDFEAGQCRLCGLVKTKEGEQ